MNRYNNIRDKDNYLCVQCPFQAKVKIGSSTCVNCEFFYNADYRGSPEWIECGWADKNYMIIDLYNLLEKDDE